MPEQTGHKPGADILECQGGAVEQFQRINPRLDLPQRAVERQRFLHDPTQHGGGHILAEKGRGDGVRVLHERP